MFKRSVSEDYKQTRVKNRRVHMANERTFLLPGYWPHTGSRKQKGRSWKIPISQALSVTF